MIVNAIFFFPVPSSPRNIRVLSKSSNHVEIAWDVPDPPNGIILRYRIQLTAEHARGLYERTDTTNFMCTDVEPYTQYQFMVCAETKAGWGDWSDPITVMTEVGGKILGSFEPINLN